MGGAEQPDMEDAEPSDIEGNIVEKMPVKAIDF